MYMCILVPFRWPLGHKQEVTINSVLSLVGCKTLIISPLCGPQGYFLLVCLFVFQTSKMEVKVSRGGAWSKEGQHQKNELSISTHLTGFSARLPLIFTRITFFISRTSFSKAINQIRPRAIFPSFAVRTFIYNQCCQVHLVVSWSGLTAFSPRRQS